MIISKKLPLLIVITSLLSLFNFTAITHASDIFKDVDNNTLYSPYIDEMYLNHFITGDTDFGIFTGKFRPDDPINRAEVAKVATTIRLAEIYGNKEKWQDYSKLQIQEKLKEKLKGYYNCNSGACSSIGGTPFTDVKEKDYDCEEKGYCNPWYSQYIYYAANKEFIKGYDTITPRVFKPKDPILRIHALKMIMVENGNIDADQDSRYNRLDNIAKSRKSFSPVCLDGAEQYILDNNAYHIDPIGAKRLLDYALLADRLNLFGNNCQIFSEYGAVTPKERADFLNKNLTRKEVPRYFSLTTSYVALEPTPEIDDTINSEKQNEGTPADVEYIELDYIVNKTDSEVLKKPKALSDEIVENKEITILTEENSEDDIPEELEGDVQYPYESLGDPFVDRVYTTTKPILAFGPNGQISIPANITLELLATYKKNGSALQNINYNGSLYTVSCDDIKTIECLDLIKQIEEESRQIEVRKDSERTREYTDEYYAYTGKAKIDDTIFTITDRLNKYYGTSYTYKEIAEINGVKNYTDLYGKTFRIGTLDGWQPPEDPDVVDIDYWNNLTVEKQKILHYHRNAYQINKLPETLDDLNENEWNRLSGEALAHNVGTEGNVDYRGDSYRRDGQQAIYDTNGNLVTTPENMGTYDYEPPGVTTLDDHHKIDIRPWLIWGNSPQDTTTYQERLDALGETKNYFLEFISY